ncbi:small hydrophilic protein [Streptomyces sp. NPDC005805]|uniref:small hydrophilic protein n=1 Tax=Streptomyces sp. NPDC005805 TaxID=3157068 RepID=UPI00340155AF
MAFTHRMATLAAVVAIPLGIAATSYALADDPASPRVPPAVELDTTPRPASPPADGPGQESSPAPSPSGTGPSDNGPSQAPTGDAVVPGPSATDDDDDDDLGDDAGDDN